MFEFLYVLFYCFRGYFFVVIDVEIVGFNVNIDVLLEIVVVIVKMDEQGILYFDFIFYYYIDFFEGVNLEFVVFEFNGIDLICVLCGVIEESVVMKELCKGICKV